MVRALLARGEAKGMGLAGNGGAGAGERLHGAERGRRGFPSLVGRCAVGGEKGAAPMLRTIYMGSLLPICIIRLSDFLFHFMV